MNKRFIIIIKTIKNNIICVFKNHSVSSHYLDSLFSNSNPIKIYTSCTRCNYPIIIFFKDKNSYYMED